MSHEIRESIIKNLRDVFDPEISINIYDLGLIYDIDLTQLPLVKVTHTLTSAFCPAADMIVAEVPNIPAGIIFKKSRTIDHFYTVYYNNIFYPNIHATWISRLSKWGHAK